MEDQVKKMIMALLAYSAQRNIPVDELCWLSAINISELQNEDRPLSAKQRGDVWLNAIHLSNDELFGLHFGESLQLAALGVVGDIVKSSQNVGEALGLCVSLTHIITPKFRVAIHHGQTTFTLKFSPLQDNWEKNPAMVHMLSLLMVFVIHELNGFLFRKIIPTEVKLSFAISNIPEYARVMRCTPILSSSENSLTFDRSYWNEPVITANYKLQKILLANVSPKLITATTEKNTLSYRIKNYLLSNSYLGFVSLDDIALNFNIATRTLQRRLKKEGVNFQQLTDDVRKTLAINYLKEGNYPIKQVSHMLGYNELSAFTRTFKRWTGITPAVYQKNLN